MKSLNQTVVAALTCLLSACGGETHTTPTMPTTSPPAAVQSQWSGTLEFTSAAPAGTCEATFLGNHANLLAQSATADLKIYSDGSSTMTLETSSGQKCIAQGTAANGALMLTTRHEMCEGYPMGLALVEGLARDCNPKALMSDGPYWGPGRLSGQIVSSEFDGHWVFDVQGFLVSRFTIDLGVRLRSR